MKHSLMLALTLIGALCICTSVPSHAYADTGDGGSDPFTGRPAIEKLEFPGGNVVEYVQLIRQHAPEANFVMMPGAEQFTMPEMELRNVSLSQAATLINSASSRPNALSSIGIDRVGDVYVVQVSIGTRSRHPSESLVISLADIVDSEIKSADLLTSIETALGLFDEGYQQAEVRYHKATHLLIARGHPAQMAHIRDVVAQLQHARQHQRERQGRDGHLREAVTQALRTQRQQHERQVNRLKARIDTLERALETRSEE